jgi:hypothetical protein
MKIRLVLAATFFIAALSTLAVAPGLDWMVLQDADHSCYVRKTSKRPIGKVLGSYKTEQEASKGLENFRRKGTCANVNAIPH